MLPNPYAESKKRKEKKANAAPGDFPPVNKETFGSGLHHPHKIRMKFLFLNIPAGSLNDALLTVLGLLGGCSARTMNRRAERLHRAQLRYLWPSALRCLHRCEASGGSARARSEASLRRCCVAVVTCQVGCCWEVNLGPSLRSRTLDQSFGAFRRLLLGDASVWTLSCNARLPSAASSHLHQWSSASHHWGSWSRSPLLLRPSVSVQPQKKPKDKC